MNVRVARPEARGDEDGPRLGSREGDAAGAALAVGVAEADWVGVTVAAELGDTRRAVGDVPGDAVPGPFRPTITSSVIATTTTRSPARTVTSVRRLRSAI
jgi:hypothetical protein